MRQRIICKLFIMCGENAEADAIFPEQPGTGLDDSHLRTLRITVKDIQAGNVMPLHETGNGNLRD